MKQPSLLHDLLKLGDQDAIAIVEKDEHWSYARLRQAVEGFANRLIELGVKPGARVCIYLPKSIDAVVACFGASHAGCVFVPINPVLKKRQVLHILGDADAEVLVTLEARLEALGPKSESIRHVLLLDAEADRSVVDSTEFEKSAPRVEDSSELAALFYTSGSTGLAKGVMLSHGNLVTGALSVAEYLELDSQDRTLSLLPLSFDAGFSQLTISFAVGATVVLLDYLLPRSVPPAIAKYEITGITGVPPLWLQLVDLRWSEGLSDSVRYFANTGGKLPLETLQSLRQTFPNAQPFLMYGLTEAFRSTFLNPDEIERRPNSIGKAIPSAEVMVVDEHGVECADEVVGELVHAGPLVAQGYWRDPERTAARFRPAPKSSKLGGVAVWSGDLVKRDAHGFLFFVGRKDDMLKTSGYRVSPSEIEEVIYDSGLAQEAVVVGVPLAGRGDQIVALYVSERENSEKEMTSYLAQELPTYMVPARVSQVASLPRNANGKFDRAKIAVDVTATDEQ